MHPLTPSPLDGGGYVAPLNIPQTGDRVRVAVSVGDDLRGELSDARGSYADGTQYAAVYLDDGAVGFFPLADIRREEVTL